MLQTLAVSNYRSLRDLVVPLAPLTVVTGANGVGKSSLYRSLKLLGDVAHGRLVYSIAQEGGLPGALWAGPETLSRSMLRGDQAITGTVRRGPVALRLGFQGDDFGYSLELGPPPASANAFPLDPEIKREVIWAGDRSNGRLSLVDRKRNVIRSFGDLGWADADANVPLYESILTRLSDPQRTPEVLLLRDRLRAWRFYDHLRTDRDAAARRPQVGSWTPAMAGDGSDLAAALFTLMKTEHDGVINEVIDDAFPGCSVGILGEEQIVVGMHQPGMLRLLRAAELSEGTLRYLMLVTALLSPFPPELIVLNEPEVSIHEDLLPALARLILRASGRAQIWVVTHSTKLAELLAHQGALHHVLAKNTGETVLVGQSLVSRPSWSWPAR